MKFYMMLVATCLLAYAKQTKEELPIGVVKKFLTQMRYYQFSGTNPEAVQNWRVSLRKMLQESGLPIAQKSVTTVDGYDRDFVRPASTRETEAQLLIDFYIPLFPMEQHQYVVSPSPVFKSEDDILAQFQIQEKSPEVVVIESSSPLSAAPNKTEDEILAKFASYFDEEGTPPKEFPEQTLVESSPVKKDENEILSQFLPPPQYSPKTNLTSEHEILQKFIHSEAHPVSENLTTLPPVQQKTSLQDEQTNAAEILIEKEPEQEPEQQKESGLQIGDQQQQQQQTLDEYNYDEYETSTVGELSERLERIIGGGPFKNGIFTGGNVGDPRLQNNHGHIKNEVQYKLLLPAAAYLIFNFLG
eukprot:TRINITY_DN123_c0_g1_i2.p1 TRINITY_DN123_c0_g1~~TRINITY_DN123_c0_g1_i2.p1  ORF type:complete len:358 (+),score=56.05 TRINITY_DN123_c0_g1_i2:117-1190(+)